MRSLASQICLLAKARTNLELVASDLPAISFSLAVEEIGLGLDLVAIAKRTHPFPSRTRKLSSSALMILGGKLPGKVGRRQVILINPR